MSARATFVALALVLAMFAAAGCGGGKKSSGKEVVVFWQFFPADQIQPVLDEFAKQNPDVTVQMEQLTWQSGLEKITASAAAGTVPDLCELGSTWFPRFAHEGALVDWSDSTAALAGQQILADMAKVDGKSYGLPWVVGTPRVLNKDHSPRRNDTTRALETAGRRRAAPVGAAGGGSARRTRGELHALFGLRTLAATRGVTADRLLTADGALRDSWANVGRSTFTLRRMAAWTARISHGGVLLALARRFRRGCSARSRSRRRR
jgi:hypothetical protein